MTRIGAALYVRCILQKSGVNRTHFYDLCEWLDVSLTGNWRQRDFRSGLPLATYFQGDLQAALDAQYILARLQAEDKQEILKWISDSEPFHTHHSSHYTLVQRSINSQD